MLESSLKGTNLVHEFNLTPNRYHLCCTEILPVSILGVLALHHVVQVQQRR